MQATPTSGLFALSPVVRVDLDGVRFDELEARRPRAAFLSRASVVVKRAEFKGVCIQLANDIGLRLAMINEPDSFLRFAVRWRRLEVALCYCYIVDKPVANT